MSLLARLGLRGARKARRWQRRTGPKGMVHPPEISWAKDVETGVRIRRLTDGPGDSHHLYFTNHGWHAGGRRLVFVSNRSGSTNLFSMNLSTGAFRQLTDEARETDELMFSCLNPHREEAYFWRGDRMIALDLQTLQERDLYRSPPGYSNNIISATGDGRFVCTVHYEDLSQRFKVDLLKGYVGFEDYWAAKPRSVIVTVDTLTGAVREILAKQAWIGHVNASPVVPHLATYCHEGPWQKVDNRIWGLDLRDGRTWPIRPRCRGESVGHEYWFSDGVTIGFHGQEADGGHFFGSVRCDNERLREFPFPMQSKHVHSNDLDLVLGDGSRKDRRIYAWRIESDAITVPRPLLRHGCSSAVQARHVHPRLSPDSKRFIYVSDSSGVGNLYEVRVRDVLGEGVGAPDSSAD